MFESMDERRHKAALSGELTPLELKKSEKCGIFAGSEGNVYETSLSECTCPDFAINGGQIPCKHMIRLAMELGEIPDDGIVSDITQANIKYYSGILKNYVKSASLDDTIKFINIMSDLSQNAGCACSANSLAFAGIPDMLNSGLFELSKNGKKIKLTKDGKKTIKSLEKMLQTRLGKFVLVNINNETLLSALKSLLAVSYFE